MSIKFEMSIPVPTYVATEEEAWDLYHLLMRRVELRPDEPFGFDTETTGKQIELGKKGRNPLDWMSDYVILWSLSADMTGDIYPDWEEYLHKWHPEQFFDGTGQPVPADDYGRWAIPGEYFQMFSGLMENPDAKMTAWNAKYDAHVSWNSRIDLWSGDLWDAMIAGHLYDENLQGKMSLKARAPEWCNIHMVKFKDLFLDITLEDGSKPKEFETDLRVLINQGFRDKVADYASMDAYAVLKVTEFLREKLSDIPMGNYAVHSRWKRGEREGVKTMWDYFLNVEVPMTKTLWRMERRGLGIDMSALKQVEPVLAKEITETEYAMNRVVGEPINTRSTPQLIKYFYDKDNPNGLQLTPWKMTKGGKSLPKPSVDKEVLEGLAMDGVELAKLILRYRKITKTKGTYIDALYAMSQWFEDSRIHPSFNQYGARCMPAGEPVLTSRGYLPIESVKVGYSVIGHSGQAKKVTWAGPTGTYPVWEVILANGLKLRTNGEHGYRLSNGQWVSASLLTTGDSVVVHSDKEEWKPIQDWSDFSVSSWGRVFNHKSNRFMTQWPKGTWGHLKVALRRNGAQKRGPDLKDYTVHRLVALAFLPEPSDDQREVRHLNGIAWDNTVRNLKWGTSKENRQDAIKQGTMLKSCPSRMVLSDEDVDLIRSTPRVHGSDTKLAKKLGVSREHVRDIRTGKRRKPAPEIIGGIAEFYKSPVVSIVELPEEKMFGVTVEGDHSHVTAGIVTHNTGRFSTSNPNSQNMPRPDSDEFGIRTMFTAGDGNKLIVADYAQLEMRIMAHMSQDENMVEAISSGMDLHCYTVSKMYDSVTYEEVLAAKNAEDPDEQQKFLKKLRQTAKAIGFGLLYGAGPKKIAATIESSKEEAKEKIDDYFRAFPGVAGFIDRTHEQCKDYEFVVTLVGRLRRLPDINNSKFMIRSMAEREAVNSIIQGSASDLTKFAMLAIENDPDLNAMGIKMINQIHDELVIEVREELAEDAAVLVKAHMERPFNGNQPLIVETPVDLKIVDNWAQAK